MLLCGDGDDLIAVGQPAHAWVSGQLARAWGNGRFGTPEPREEVCLAAEQQPERQRVPGPDEPLVAAHLVAVGVEPAAELLL